MYYAIQKMKRKIVSFFFLGYNKVATTHYYKKDLPIKCDVKTSVIGISIK